VRYWRIDLQVNDRYEFYDELDLDRRRRYLSSKANRTIKQHYKLHSVLVHSGGSSGGHYCSIAPTA
jgi:ubiquitin carboxyl-terminal hydrolase 7